MVATKDYLAEAKEAEHYAAVTKSDSFDDDAAEADAKTLRKAMKGIGTSEDPIIEIFSKRTSEELQTIAAKYKACFGRELLKDLTDELRDELERAVVGRLYSGPEFDAYHCREAMKGVGTKEDTLIDVLMPKTNEQLKQIKEAYKAQYDRDLVDDVRKEITGDLEKLLLAMLACGREAETEVDEEQAAKEAKELYEAGEGSWGTDEGTFNRIMCLRSFNQLRATFEKYTAHAGRENDGKPSDIREAIIKEFKGHLEKAYLAMVDNMRDPRLYYANVLNDCMRGMGTKDQRLTRTIQSRCEYDLLDIGKAFEKMTGNNLKEKIKKETRGDYEKMLLGMCTPN